MDQTGGLLNPQLPIEERSASLPPILLDLEVADSDIIASGLESHPSADRSEDKISPLQLSDNIDAEMDLLPSPVPEVRQHRRTSRQGTSCDARRASLAIAKNFDMAVAEDGLLGDDEMSQLSGKTLDLRNSAALLKMARMSVDATALEDRGIRAFRPSNLEMARSTAEVEGAGHNAELAGAPAPILADSPRMPAAGGRPPRGAPSQQPLRASAARPKLAPRMLASISEDCMTGSGGEEAVLHSPLVTPRIHPERCRGNTFSPPDTLRDSMALFLQLEGAVEDRSPFKPAEVLQLHAQQKPSTSAAHPGSVSRVPELDNHLAANAGTAQSARAVPEQEPKTGCEANETLAARPVSRALGGRTTVQERKPAVSSLRRPTALGRALPKAPPAARTGPVTHGQSGQPDRPAADRRAGTPQSSLQRIHQRVSEAAAKARKLPGFQRTPKVASGTAAASSRLGQGSAKAGSTAATSAPRTSAANAGSDMRCGNGAGRIPGPPRRAASATGNATVGSVHATVPDQAPRQQTRGSAPGRVPDQTAARLGPGPLAAGRAHASSGAQAHRERSNSRAERAEKPQQLRPSRLPAAQHKTPTPPKASPGFLRMLEEAMQAEEKGMPFGGTGRALRNSPAEGKADQGPTRLTAEQRHCLEYKDY